MAPCEALRFVLYGGTALALQLGHRASVDFNFFSSLPLDSEREKKLLADLPFLKDARLIQKEPNTRSYVTGENVKLSFFGDIRLGRVGEPLVTADGVLRMASLKDLMATKLAVVMQRVESKDYRDIAALLRCGTILEEGLAGASALYGAQFPPSECVRSLTYFQGGDLDTLPERDRDTLLDAARHLRIERLPEVSLLSRDLD